ncbi:MAG TPA: hypothetical protein VFQ54_02835, partial [Thermomicrobiales bacterium]|nr:hypothetical protein [Thermomicrobiales bacterium]
GAFGNAVILDGEILVFGRTADVIEEVIAQSDGTTASMLDTVGVVETLNAFSPEMVSAIGVSSKAFQTSYPTMTPEQVKEVKSHLAESDDAVGKMPAIEVGAFGVLAGAVLASGDSEGTPEATPVDASSAIAQTRLFLGSASKAKQAAKVVDWRWNHLDSLLIEVPYNQIMTLESAGASDVVDTVAAIDFGGSTAAGNWSRLILTGDVLPFS